MFETALESRELGIHTQREFSLLLFVDCSLQGTLSPNQKFSFFSGISQRLSLVAEQKLGPVGAESGSDASTYFEIRELMFLSIFCGLWFLFDFLIFFLPLFCTFEFIAEGNGTGSSSFRLLDMILSPTSDFVVKRVCSSSINATGLLDTLSAFILVDGGSWSFFKNDFQDLILLLSFAFGNTCLQYGCYAGSIYC